MDRQKFHFIFYTLFLAATFADSKILNTNLSPTNYNSPGFLSSGKTGQIQTSKRDNLTAYAKPNEQGTGLVVNKKQLVNEVADELGKTRKDVTTVVDEFFKTLTKHMCNNAEVTIPKFGVFHNSLRGERRMRNLQTGEIFTAEPVYVPNVRFYNTLKDEINEKLKNKK